MYVGLTSEEPGRDDDREWWARIMGWMLLVAVVWVAASALSLLSGLGFRALMAKWNSTAVYGALGTVTAVATSLGLLGAKSASSGAREQRVAPSWRTYILEAVPGVAARIAVAGLFILLAIGLERALQPGEVRPTELQEPVAPAQIGPIQWTLLGFQIPDSVANYFPDTWMGRLIAPANPAPATVGPQDPHYFLAMCRDPDYRTKVTLCFFGLLAFVSFSGKRINSNRLSLHAVYRDRLIRAFLGASNADRCPDPFTGFDPDDNIPMHHLRRRQYFTADDFGIEREERVRAVAKLLVLRAMPFYRHVWELGRPADLHAINAEYDRARKFGSAVMRADTLLPHVLGVLNQAVIDPQLIWKSRFKTDEDRAQNGNIAWAFRRLEEDGCPILLNRLVLEEEFYDQGPSVQEAPALNVDRRYLLKGPATAPQAPRPLHVLNLALNLVQGEKLAWQQRKASSFTVSPLHSGFSEGYRPSVEFGGAISLGTAMTISGAAASPNMGYHSSPAVTFLMTLFNVRLGWWLGNPASVRPSLFDRFLGKLGLAKALLPRGERFYQLAGPDHSMRPLLDEALGRTNDKNGYVYLSDGGHFDNLGLYEMVRRRCRYIVVSDASCDAKCNFEDLANAVRKVRIDLGIPIEIREILFFPDAENVKNGKYCAVGDIKYAAVDGEGIDDGKLIYIKPARHPQMPVDLYSHSQTNQFFPHEPTANQWFSESQFESYRNLGFETVEAICESSTKATGKPSAEPICKFGTRRVCETVPTPMSLKDFVAAATGMIAAEAIAMTPFECQFHEEPNVSASGGEPTVEAHVQSQPSPGVDAANPSAAKNEKATKTKLGEALAENLIDPEKLGLPQDVHLAKSEGNEHASNKKAQGKPKGKSTGTSSRKLKK